MLLRGSKGKHLTRQEGAELSKLIEKYDDIFRPGEDTAPTIKHYIDAGNNPPVAVPPYHMSPPKKEILKNELHELLAKGTIEE